MEPVEIKVRPRYWDRTTAIQYAVPGAINTIPAENFSYNKEEIFKFIRRSADKLWVINDGTDNLYVRYATEGVESFSDENVVFPKEYKVYYNVFELRLRSPTAGLPYRVSEFEILPCCKISGPSVPTLLKNGYTSIGSISGGVIISSGTIIRVSLQNIPGNDIVWLGAAGVNSGAGYLLVAGNEKQINIDNLNKVCVYAQTSGEYICYLAETE